MRSGCLHREPTHSHRRIVHYEPEDADSDWAGLYDYDYDCDCGLHLDSDELDLLAELVLWANMWWRLGF